MLEQHFDYGKPFYEFFKIVKLQGLNKEESLTFLRAIGEGEQKEKIEKIIQNEPARIETLRRLTGGVPRTLVMLFDIFLDDGGNAFDDLLKILDEATPLYKHRMDDLPPVLQDIVHAMAINWDGMYAKEIAKKTRLESKVVSAQLKQLERKYGIVESEAVGKKNKIYKIQERFFNIWYLMRFGRKKDRQRVEWLVKFLESWCTKDELEERSKKLIENIKDGNVSVNYAYHMCEALGYCGIDGELEYLMKEETRNYLEKNESTLIDSLSKSQKQILIDVILFSQDDDWENAANELDSLKNKSEKELDLIDHFYETAKDHKAIWDKIFVKHEEKKVVIKFKNKYARALVLLLNGNYNESEKKILEVIKYATNENKAINFESYFLFLLAEEQYYKLKDLLELPEYNLKDKYKPIWFALMHLMENEYPDEMKKTGEEFQESIDEIINGVKFIKENYEQDT